MTDSLDSLRNQIDELDQKLQDLLNERATLAHKVAEVKTATNPTRFSTGLSVKPRCCVGSKSVIRGRWMARPWRAFSVK